jgi:hypothetical protein
VETPGARKRVFISYSRLEPDQRVAGQLYQALRDWHDVFYDVLIEPGEDWGQRIEQELQTADYFIVLLSEKSVAQEGVQGEIEIACEISRHNAGKPVIIPVRVQYEKRLPYALFMRLRRLQHFSWSGDSDTGRIVDRLRPAMQAGVAPAPVEAPASAGAPSPANAQASAQAPNPVKPLAAAAPAPTTAQPRPSRKAAVRFRLVRKIDFGQGLDSWRGETVCAAVTPDGSRMLSGSSASYVVRVWELATGVGLFALAFHNSGVHSLVVAPDGGLAISGGEDNTIRVWNQSSGKHVFSLKGHTGRVRALAVTPDGSRLISGSTDRTVRVWDLSAGAMISMLTGHVDEVRALAVTPDGGHAVSGSDDKTVFLWDLNAQRAILKCEGHTHWVMAVTSTADTIVSGSADKSVRGWDLRTGQEVFKLEGHTNNVRSAAVTPDGAYLLTGSDDRTVKVWDLRKRRQVGGFKCESECFSCSIARDGQTVLVAEAKRLCVLRLETA